MDGIRDTRHPLRRAWPALLLALTSACSVGPEYAPPDSLEDPHFLNTDADRYSDAEPEVTWWRSFDDAELTRLVEQALLENHDVRIAASNVAAARAFLSERRLDRYPTVTAAGSVVRQDGIGAQQFQSGGERVTLYDAGFDAAWELDFFGRVRHGIEASTADFEATVAERHDVAVTVAAEVAAAYVELRGAQHRLAVATRNAANQEQTYELTQVLLDGGRGTQLDIARARAQFETTLASIEPLQAEVRRNIHRLGVLVGVGPTELAATLSRTAPIPALPGSIGIGDASGLLRRRADIRAAERRLAAQTARIGIATANLFPRVTLTGSAGYLATSSSGFGDSDSERTSIGPFISWPAFDLGRVRAQVAAESAAAEASLARYEQATLVALEETENALVGYLRALSQRERLQAAADASEEAVSLARVRFRNGVDSFLSVLDAERRLLETEDQLALSETNTALSFVALYKALGGGWQRS